MLTKFTAILDDLDLVLVIIYSAFYQFLQLIFHTQNFTNNFSSKKISSKKYSPGIGCLIDKGEDVIFDCFVFWILQLNTVHIGMSG